MRDVNRKTKQLTKQNMQKSKGKGTKKTRNVSLNTISDKNIFAFGDAKVYTLDKID